MLQLSQIAFAQKKFVEGKIITNNNDTISGFISINPAFTNKYQIAFSKTSSGESAKNYYPDQLSKFTVDNKEYLSLPVNYNGKDNLYFIRRISFGYYNLYEGFKNNGEKIFFLQTKSDQIIYLEEELKKEWINQYFSDCTFKPSHVYYDEVSLKNLVSKYSQCKQPETFIHQKEKYKPTITIGFRVGLNTSLMEFTNKINPYSGDSFNHKWSVHGGLVFNIEINRFLQFEADLLYSQSKGDLTDSVTFDFTRTDVNIPILLRYVFRNDSRIEPYINAGLDFRILLEEQFQYTSSEGEIDFDPAKGVTGLLFGAGTFIKISNKFKILFDFRYSFSEYLSHSRPFDKYSLKNQVYTLSTGILF